MLQVALLFVIVAVTSAEETDLKKCEKIIDPSILRCCKVKAIGSFTNEGGVIDCFKIPFNPQTCERETCISTIKGLASEEGVIYKEDWAKYVEANNLDKPEMVKEMKDKCIFGDISKYGSPDFCNLVKLGLCLKIHFFSECSEWDDSPHCDGIKDLAIECKSKHDNV